MQEEKARAAVTTAPREHQGMCSEQKYFHQNLHCQLPENIQQSVGKGGTLHYSPLPAEFR